MRTVDFLSVIWPQTGRFCVTKSWVDAAGKRYFKNYFHDSPLAAANQLAAIAGAGFDAFHLCATLQPNARQRRDADVLATRCLYLDLDVKTGAYVSQEAA